MSPKLARVNLGAAGLDHVKDRIAWGMPLSRVLGDLLLEQGEAWTWAPPSADLHITDLADSDLPDGVTQESQWDLMKDFVVEYLAGRERLAIIEDRESSPNSQWLKTQAELPPNLPRLGFGDHLYWYATEPDRVLVADMMRWGFGLFKCMVLTRPGGEWPHDHAVTAADLEGLAPGVDHLVVDAFDFDGFVIWSRTSRPAE